MSSSRTALLAVVVVALAAYGFHAYGLGPKREQVAALAAEATAQRDQAAASRAKAREYLAAKATFKADYARVKRLGKAVPNDDNVRSLILQVDRQAGRSKTDFRKIELSGAGGAAASATPAAGAATQAAAAALPPGSAVGTAGFPTMPFTFGFRGSFTSLSAFLDRIDGLVRVDGEKVTASGRLLAMDAFSLEPGPGGFPNLDATVSATGFLIPGAGEDPAALAGSAGAAAPTGAAAAGGAAAPPASSSIGVVR